MCLIVCDHRNPERGHAFQIGNERKINDRINVVVVIINHRYNVSPIYLHTHLGVEKCAKVVCLCAEPKV
jgi:hypothetical protein